MLLAGLALFVVASLMAALAPSIHVLIAARLLQAVGGAAGIVLARAMVRDVFNRETSASVISYITMAFVVAPMVAPAIGGYIDTHGGWRMSFWLLRRAGCGGARRRLALPARDACEPRRRRPGPWASSPARRGSSPLPRFRGYTLVLAFTSSVFFAFLGGAPHIMMDVLGRTPMEYGLWFVHRLGWLHDGELHLGPLHPRGGARPHDHGGLRHHAVRTGFLCFAAAITGLLSPATLFLPMCLAALGNGLTIPNGTAGAISVDQRLTGAAAGWSGFAQMACGAAASQLVGSLQVFWPTAVFWFMAVASLAALLAHMGAVRKPRTFATTKSFSPPDIR